MTFIEALLASPTTTWALGTISGNFYQFLAINIRFFKAINAPAKPTGSINNAKAMLIFWSFNYFIRMIKLFM